jgi:MoaA/NifB/PqqE/SkfB family radical SAM enzyme
MDILKEKGVPFGYSVCVTRKNAEVVISDEFVDLMIEKGALIGWYFLYMPVCGDKNTELMPTPEQRDNQRLRRNYIRATKPLFIIDFWNDAPYVGGCIAAKYYSHINIFGDVEPCIFTHFAQVNIKDTSLKEAMKCPFFKEIRARQPFTPNLLMPCMLIDHPKVIRELCQACHPRPTHPGATTLIEDLKDDLDKYSLKVHQIYDKIWEEKNPGAESK